VGRNDGRTCISCTDIKRCRESIEYNLGVLSQILDEAVRHADAGHWILIKKRFHEAHQYLHCVAQRLDRWQELSEGRVIDRAEELVA
jgi:hypothetical protein